MLRLIVLCLVAAILLPVEMEAKARNTPSTPNRRAARAQTRIHKGRNKSTRTWKKVKPVKAKAKVNPAYRIREH